MRASILAGRFRVSKLARKSLISVCSNVESLSFTRDLYKSGKSESLKNFMHSFVALHLTSRCSWAISEAMLLLPNNRTDQIVKLSPRSQAYNGIIFTNLAGLRNSTSITSVSALFFTLVISTACLHCSFIPTLTSTSLMLDRN